MAFSCLAILFNGRGRDIDGNTVTRLILLFVYKVVTVG
jgi:hypothetical protein